MGVVGEFGVIQIATHSPEKTPHLMVGCFLWYIRQDSTYDLQANAISISLGSEATSNSQLSYGCI